MVTIIVQIGVYVSIVSRAVYANLSSFFFLSVLLTVSAGRQTHSHTVAYTHTLTHTNTQHHCHHFLAALLGIVHTCRQQFWSFYEVYKFLWQDVVDWSSQLSPTTARHHKNLVLKADTNVILC